MDVTNRHITGTYWAVFLSLTILGYIEGFYDAPAGLLITVISGFGFGVLLYGYVYENLEEMVQAGWPWGGQPDQRKGSAPLAASPTPLN
ncbi:MAG: hypothetical protein SVU88_04485 [Candidatus Nanohaloarchaea archaeon]|nr:hypothetical protein [Candidatus Nanohaloarchaea archaeon]